MGLFISFEGGDGAGKGTQAALLSDALIKRGAVVKLEAFPRHEGPLKDIINDYLNGKFGTKNHPVLASLPYTVDRALVKEEVQHYRLLNNGVYIADRFDDSNDGHQGAKLKTREERLAFFERQRLFEHDVMGVPEPDITILLPVPPALAQQNIDKKESRLYTNKKRDMHEADIDHLQNAYESFMLLAEQNPDRIIIVNPVENDGKTMRSKEAIHNDILQILAPVIQSKVKLV